MHTNINKANGHVFAENAMGKSPIVLVCEHATNFIPASFDALGLSDADQNSHVAWDPGAMGVARDLSQRLDAPLIAGAVSRLVYDCNRPPTAVDAMPARSEIIDVPGNQNLSQAERHTRTEAYYRPFQAALTEVLEGVTNPILVTIHSFTPVFHGKQRSVDIGVLHDSDARLADALLEIAGQHTAAAVRRNEPYGPEHGVTHTLQEHAIRDGRLNVMLEIRNDLIETPEQQSEMSATLASWIAVACAQLKVSEVVQCHQ